MLDQELQADVPGRCYAVICCAAVICNLSWIAITDEPVINRAARESSATTTACRVYVCSLTIRNALRSASGLLYVQMTTPTSGSRR
jgi:hypothetical protein